MILLLFLKKELLYHFYFIYFFVVTASFCIPTNGGQVFQLFHFSHEWLLFSEFFNYFFKIMAILMDVRWYLILVLICFPY